VLGPAPALPVAFDAHLLGVADDLDKDALDQQTDEGLAFLLGGCLGPPYGWKIAASSSALGINGRSRVTASCSAFSRACSANASS